MSNVWKTAGSVRRGKNKTDATGKELPKSGNLYLKVDADIKAGQTVQLQDPRKKIAASVAAGRLTEEKAEAMLSKLPDYILYDLVIPPANK